MNSKDVQFWQTEGINHLRWQGAPKFYEGVDNVKAVVRLVGDSTVRDVGCGYGRLVEFYNPEKYIGYDICESAIKKAKTLNPKYTFYHWDFSKLLPAEVTTFINGPHLVSDDEIEELFSILCVNTKAVVFAEPMEDNLRRYWKNLPYGTHTRNIEVYDSLFQKYNFKRVDTYVGTHLTDKINYTAARWELFN